MNSRNVPELEAAFARSSNELMLHANQHVDLVHVGLPIQKARVRFHIPNRNQTVIGGRE